MTRKKLIKTLVVLLLVAIAIFPVTPKFGDRPRMTHNQWSSNAGAITDQLFEFEDIQRGLGKKMMQVNVDQLTGLNGYSLLGVESFFGHRSTTVVGYIPEDYANQFVMDGEAIWIDVDGLDRLRQIISDSEQDEEGNREGRL